VQLAAALQQSFDLEPVFIGAPEDDLTPFRAFRTVQGATFSELARLMRDASLFIGNDSGPAHVAAAFGVPEVVLFGPSSLSTWAPWRTPSEAIKTQDRIDSITVQQAIAAMERLGVQARPKASKCPKASK
jgi:ADP-heptose:LPS heptosyltransferase